MTLQMTRVFIVQETTFRDLQSPDAFGKKVQVIKRLGVYGAMRSAQEFAKEYEKTRSGSIFLTSA
jgi:hypothetical protein